MLSIIGSTGSVGQQTLEVLDHLNEHAVALVAHRDVKTLEKQCRRYLPKLAVLADEDAAKDLRVRLSDTQIRVCGGDEAVLEAAAHPEADTTLVATTGFAGLNPVLAAIGHVKKLALANKESIVYAGSLIMDRISKSQTKLFPIDSELSAIHQCIDIAQEKEILHIVLTASGGPFWGRSLESMQNVTLEEALHHPVWSMGKKISIDSATLLNKGYEIFEILHYFNTSVDKISVMIHRESIVHAVVQFAYGATYFNLAVPDMTLPIQYALTYPERKASLVKQLDLTASKIKFTKPDLQAFPCLALSIEAARRGGLFGAVLAAAGEVAVERFIAGTLSFTDIAACVEAALEHTPNGDAMVLDDILSVDRETRAFAQAFSPQAISRHIITP